MSEPVERRTSVQHQPSLSERNAIAGWEGIPYFDAERSKSHPKEDEAHYSEDELFPLDVRVYRQKDLSPELISQIEATAAPLCDARGIFIEFRREHRRNLGLSNESDPLYRRQRSAENAEARSTESEFSAIRMGMAFPTEQHRSNTRDSSAFVRVLRDENHPAAPYIDQVVTERSGAAALAARLAKREYRIATITTASTFFASVFALAAGLLDRATLTIVPGVLAALATGLLAWARSARWRPVSDANASLARALTRELALFEFGAGPYEQVSDPNAEATLLVNRTEDLYDNAHHEASR